MSPKSVLITGSSRGIGLELVGQYLLLDNPPTHLIAAYRNMSDALKSVAERNPCVKLLQMEVTKYAEYPAVFKQVEDIVGEDGLNLLINNAGINLEDNSKMASHFQQVTPEMMREVYETNTIAPLMLTKALLPLLTRAAHKLEGPELSTSRAAVVQMSSDLGSITNNTMGGFYSYRASKSALNMDMKSLSVDLKDTGVLFLSMHPGWVVTDMGGPNAHLDVVTSGSSIVKTLEVVSTKDQGGFLQYDNKPIPW